MPCHFEHIGFGTPNLEKRAYVIAETKRLRAKGWSSSDHKLKWVVDKKASRKFGSCR